MRIATWNVNSLKARMEKVEWWLERAQPDVLLLQETKLADSDAPHAGVLDGRLRASPTTARAAGTAWRSPAGTGSASSGPVTNFGLGGVARLERRVVGGSARTTSTRSTKHACSASSAAASASSASTRRTGASSARRSTRRSSNWYARLVQWLREAASPDDALVIGGDFNLAPTDDDVWDADGRPRRHARVGGRAGGVPPVLDVGPRRCLPLGPSETGRYTWWDYRAGISTRTSGCASTTCSSRRRREPDRRRGDRPRGAQGQADPVRPRAPRARPRRAGRAVRRGLGGGRRADRGPRRHQAEVATPR